MNNQYSRQQKQFLDKIKKHSSNTTSLHLRNANLDTNDIAVIATFLKQNHTIQSISLSYNSLGDSGIIAIIENLPISIKEIGLVNCKIGDKGGFEVLRQAKKLPHLQMICIEQNHFSPKMQQEFQNFKIKNPHIIVIY